MRNNGLPAIVIFGIAVCLTIIIVLRYFNDPFCFDRIGADAPSYVAMAEGHPEQVHVYYARRILHPFIVGRLLSFMETDVAFSLVAIVSLLFFLWIELTVLYRKIKLPIAVSVVLIFLPFLFSLYHGLHNQGLFFIFLSSLCYFFLIRKKYLMSLLVLFLLILTREEAIVILLSFILLVSINILRKQRGIKYYFYLITAIILGILAWRIITYTVGDKVTPHNMPLPTMLILKMPAFLVGNLTGLRHWVDSYKDLYFYPHYPLIIFDAPWWIKKISSIKQMGIYEWNPSYPISTFAIILSLFGTGPTILLYLLKARGLKNIFTSLGLGTILVSGILLSIVAVCVGPPSWRYYSLAWGLYYFIVPFFFREIYKVDKKAFTVILLLHILSAWLFILYDRLGTYLPMAVVILIVEIFLHIYTYYKLSIIHKRELSLLPLDIRF